MCKTIAVKGRPICINHGCDKPVIPSTGKVTDKNPRWRAVCGTCQTASYGGGKLAEGVTPFITGKCKNIDGHLGWDCFTNWDLIPADMKGITEIDHKDGDHKNNVLENVQELCVLCHKYKGQQEGDYKQRHLT